MPDVHDRATRSRNMAAVRGKDTKPELIIRKGLHAAGLRYRLHLKDLPGKPDLVFPKHRAAVFVHGCFWHGHACALFTLPGTRAEFWQEKIEGNISRDESAATGLHELGWRVAVVWECALRGRDRLSLTDVLIELSSWIRSDAPRLTIAGSGAAPG
ncbi:MAG: very short patch repair endonuclease [Hyphomonas sp.]|nr:very short patch repair endonuclease [Hyphomonas sp.]